MINTNLLPEDLEEIGRLYAASKISQATLKQFMALPQMIRCSTCGKVDHDKGHTAGCGECTILSVMMT